MTKDKSRLEQILNIVVPFAGPLIFEIVNNVTGDWVNAEGKFYLSTGKLITILIGLTYIVVMGILLYRSEKENKSLNVLQGLLNDAEKSLRAYEKTNETACTLLAYLRDKIKEQIDYFKEHNKIDVRNLNINSASATICKMIYQNIEESNDIDIKITVNMYDKISENGTEYSMMIAHEGHVSQPDAFGVRKILKSDKTNMRYCDKILMSNSPDYKILLEKKDVAKAFGINHLKCKYNQYMGLPIRKKGGTNIALIEIVAHEDTVIWENEDAAKVFAAEYCEILKEYVLLLDRMYEQGEAIAQRMDKGGVWYE